MDFFQIADVILSLKFLNQLLLIGLSHEINLIFARSSQKYRYKYKDTVTVTSTCHSLRAEGVASGGIATCLCNLWLEQGRAGDHGQEELIMQMQQSKSQEGKWRGKRIKEGRTRKRAKHKHKDTKPEQTSKQVASVCRHTGRMCNIFRSNKKGSAATRLFLDCMNM